VLVSPDFGETWAELPTGGVRAEDVGGVDVSRWPTARFVHVDAEGRLILETTATGGESWTAETLPGAYPDGVGEIQTKALDNRLYVQVELPSSSASSVAVLMARNGGDWQQLDLPVAGPMTVNSSDQWFVAGGPLGDRLYRTMDAGDHWKRLTVEAPGSLPAARPVMRLPVVHGDAMTDAVLLADPDVDRPLFLATYSGSVGGDTLVTDGHTVRISEDGSGAAIDAAGGYVVVAAPSQHGFAVSRDSGATFSAVPFEAAGSSPVTSLHVTSDGHVWAVATHAGCQGDKIGCSVASTLYSSADAGQTWTQVAI
jgi:hypothetical protein